LRDPSVPLCLKLLAGLLYRDHLWAGRFWRLSPNHDKLQRQELVPPFRYQPRDRAQCSGHRTQGGARPLLEIRLLHALTLRNYPLGCRLAPLILPSPPPQRTFSNPILVYRFSSRRGGSCQTSGLDHLVRKSLGKRGVGQGGNTTEPRVPPDHFLATANKGARRVTKSSFL